MDFVMEIIRETLDLFFKILGAIGYMSIFGAVYLAISLYWKDGLRNHIKGILFGILIFGTILFSVGSMGCFNLIFLVNTIITFLK